MAWNSDLYLKFANERNQPCLDLLSRLGSEYNRILDLGCGPGNSTENLLKKYTDSTVIGFDADDTMLKKARKDHNGIEFIKGYAPNDFNRLTGKFDLVFSNACIHWIEDQERLIDSVYELLNEKGVFAVQIPLTEEAVFYKILQRIVEEKYPRLKSIQNFHNLTQEEYYNTLEKKFKNITMWQSNYYHTVDRSSVLEWYKGSGLRPYIALLGEREQEELLTDLQEAINATYPLLSDGKVFLVMPRLFFTAEKCR